MEGEGVETGKSRFRRLKDRVRSRLSRDPKLAETDIQGEPKPPPKVLVGSPSPSRTLGAKPPAWLETESDRIEAGRAEDFRQDSVTLEPVAQTPAPEYAAKFDEPSNDADANSDANPAPENLRPGSVTPDQKAKAA